MIKSKRVYDEANITDGDRVLVERSWPRGIRRSTTNIDYWIKDAGPSEELKRWYLHNPGRWAEFKERYKRELQDGRAIKKLAACIADKDPVTLLYMGSDKRRNIAAVLIEVLNSKVGKELLAKLSPYSHDHNGGIIAQAQQLT